MHRFLKHKATTVASTACDQREDVARPRLNTVEVTCDRLGVGRTMLYRLMHADPAYRKGLPHLRSVAIGGKRLISDAAIEQFIAELEARSSTADAA